jgi:hypothetical protein
MRRFVLAALLSTMGFAPCAAKDVLLGDLTEDQMNAIGMTSIARIAGSNDTCPRYHVIMNAVFEEMREAKIPPELLSTQEFKNAVTIATLGALERKKKDPSDFCRAAWQLFGPGGLYRRQMLEAN